MVLRTTVLGNIITFLRHKTNDSEQQRIFIFLLVFFWGGGVEKGTGRRITWFLNGETNKTIITITKQILKEEKHSRKSANGWRHLKHTCMLFFFLSNYENIETCWKILMWLGGSLIHTHTPYSGDGLPAATHTRQDEFYSNVTTSEILLKTRYPS